MSVMNFPYVVWDNWTELAITDVDALHFVANAWGGAFGAQARAFVQASMTQGKLNRLSRRFSSHYRNSVDLAIGASIGGTHVMVIGHHSPQPSDYETHCTAVCTKCFGFLIHYGLISSRGWYHVALSYFMNAGLHKSSDLQYLMIQRYPTLTLMNRIGLRYITDVNALGNVSYDERLVRAFVDKVYKMKLYSNWSTWIEPHEILEMAPWIDLAFAKKLLTRNINIAEGAEEQYTDPSVGGMWQALIVHKNPARLALFEFMRANFIPPTIGNVATRNSIHLLSEIGWDGGFWHPWATAIRYGDQVAAKWFYQCPDVDPMRICNTALIPAGIQVPSLYIEWRASTNWKFIGYAATLKITKENAEMLHDWLLRSRSPLTQKILAAAPQDRAKTIQMILDLLERIIRTSVNQRHSIELPTSGIRRPSWARAQKELQDRTISMIKDVQENIVHLDAADPTDHSVIHNTIFDCPEYHRWVKVMEESGMDDIGLIIKVLKKTYNTLPQRRTRAGKK